MERGWVRQWRCETEYPVWDMPPLALKLWRWIVMSADYKTGVLERSTPQIADAIQWKKNNAPEIPDRKTIHRLLQMLEDANLLATMVVGDLPQRFLRISVCNWNTYYGPEIGACHVKSASLPHQLDGTKEVQEVQEVPGVSADPPERSVKKRSVEKRLEKLHASPHWQYIERVSLKFMDLPHAYKLSPSDLVSAQEEIERTLRIDFEDAPTCEKRLSAIIAFAIEDEFWGTQGLQSLGSLRSKRGGVPKWKSIEAKMVRQKTVEPPRPSLRHVSEILAEQAPPVDPDCSCDVGWVVHPDKSRTPCPHCARGRYHASHST